MTDTLRIQPKWLLALTFTSISGCADAPSVNVVARDSAGISIVESRAEESFLALSDTSRPAFVVRYGDERQPLHRIVGASVLNDSVVTVAEASTSKIHLYKLDGTWLRSLGRRGEGPGEFRTIERLIPISSDTVAVLSSGHIDLVTETGFLDRIRLPFPLGELARLQNGSWVGWGRALSSEALGVIRAPQPLLSVDIEGHIDTIAVMPGLTRLAQSALPGTFRSSTVAFSARSLFTPYAEGLVVGDATAHELRFLTSDGRLTRIARWHGKDLSVGDRDLVEWREAYIASAYTPPGQDPKVLEEIANAMPAAPHKPAYVGLLAADDGALWINVNTVPGAREEYVVIGTAGQWIRTVLMPNRFKLLSVVRGQAIGIMRSDLGEEEIRAYTLY